MNISVNETYLQHLKYHQQRITISMNTLGKIYLDVKNII